MTDELIKYLTLVGLVAPMATGLLAWANRRVIGAMHEHFASREDLAAIDTKIDRLTDIMLTKELSHEKVAQPISPRRRTRYEEGVR